MKKFWSWSFLLLPWLFAPAAVAAPATIKLPPAQLKGAVPLEQAMQNRRSVRSYRDSPLELSEIAQLAWAAQGITNPQGFRTAPSAGALYPLELYLLAADVTGLEPGIYHYIPGKHVLEQISSGDRRWELSAAAYLQSPLRRAPAVFVIAGVRERTARKYGGRSERYVWIEAGHAGQNLLLQATALGLGSVMIGAFSDSAVKKALGLEEDEQPISLLPVGRP